MIGRFVGLWVCLVLVTVAQLLARHAAEGPIPLGYDDPHDVLHPDNSPLHHRVPQVLADPTVQKRLVELGQDIPPVDQQTPEALHAYHKAEIEKWWPIIKAANIKGQ